MANGEGFHAELHELRAKANTHGERIAVLDAQHQSLHRDIDRLGDKLRSEIAEVKVDLGKTEERILAQVEAASKRTDDRFAAGRAWLFWIGMIGVGILGAVIGLLVQ